MQINKCQILFWVAGDFIILVLPPDDEDTSSSVEKEEVASLGQEVDKKEDMKNQGNTSIEDQVQESSPADNVVEAGKEFRNSND